MPTRSHPQHNGYHHESEVQNWENTNTIRLRSLTFHLDSADLELGCGHVLPPHSRYKEERRC